MFQQLKYTSSTESVYEEQRIIQILIWGITSQRARTVIYFKFGAAILD